MKITKVDSLKEIRTVKHYKDLEPNDAFTFIHDEELRIKTPEGHTTFHGKAFGKNVNIGNYTGTCFGDRPVFLLDVDIKWAVIK